MAWSPRVIDLTRPMTDATLVELAGREMVDEASDAYKLRRTWHQSWDASTLANCHWEMFDHFGTHVDAPLHMLRDGKSIDQLPADSFFGEAIVLDCRFAQGRGITAQDLEVALPGVERGDIVLICSAEPPATLDSYVLDQTYVTASAAQWLVEAGAKAVGLEAWSLEHSYENEHIDGYLDPTTPNPFPAHKILLRNQIYVIEGLCNLEQIVGRRVRFAALPLPVPGSTGSPVRAIAWEID